MGKITAKHFLNTNLKPYVISGTKHYSIYILLVANRQNTKVKSINFDEYYSEETFNEIINSNNIEDKELISNEISTIIRITEITLEILNTFDTAFITSYFKFCSMYNLGSKSSNNSYDSKEINNLFTYYEYYSTNPKNNIYNIKLKEDLKNDNQDYLKKDRLSDYLNEFRSTTLFDFFNDKNQIKIKEYIKQNTFLGVKEIEEIMKEYNENIFYSSLKRFSEVIAKTKNSFLTEKYSNIFGKSERKTPYTSFRKRFSISDL